MFSHRNSARVLALLLSGAASVRCAAAAETAATPQINIEEIVVTATLNRSRFDIIQATSVLSGENLADSVKGSIGETLAKLPGVSSTFFGPYASRPVIRGFDGDRIRVLFDGIGSIDASSVSPDHEVAGETSGAERIEVMRGPATLLYGTSAVGGVVNIIDGRIPDMAPTGGVEGTILAGGGSNASELFANGSVNAAVGGGLILHADGGWRDTKNYRVHGFANDDAEEAGIEGRVPNSDGSIKNGTGGLSYVWDGGIVGTAVERFASDYGSPAEPGVLPGEDPVSIKLRQTRVDVKGAFNTAGNTVSALRLRGSYGDYKHTEFEGDEVGTVFTNRGGEARLEAELTPMGIWNGVAGVQYRDRDFSAIGEESFVPPTNTQAIGAFLMETADLGRLRLEAGGRVELTRSKAPALAVNRSFTSTALSAAAALEVAKDTLAGLTLTWTQRPPTPEELFADGPHVATNQFEVGDTTLRQERAVNVEATLRHRAGPLTGSVSVYRTWYDRFIFPQETGTTEDDLPVFQFAATNARFAGAEAEGVLQILERRDMTVTVDGALDYVRATDVTNGEPLPRISPWRYRGGAEVNWPLLTARLEVQGAGTQNRVAPLETPTDGYTFVNAKLVLRLDPEGQRRLVIQGLNLANAEGRPHTSFIKDAAPLPGRDIRVYLQANF